MRLSARGRLTLLYTGLVLAAGIVLAGLTYVLVRRSMADRIGVLTIDGPLPGPPPPPPDLAEIAGQVRDETLTQLLVQAAIALAVVTVLAAVLGWLVAGRVLRPIRTISATARRLSAENLSERVPVVPPADELAALAGTINGMLDRIERGVADRDRVLDGQRMFTANAAHELRTPLTTMRTAIDVTLDGSPTRVELLTMAGDVRDAVGQSQRTLDGLLALARSSAGLGTLREVDLAVIASAALAGCSCSVRADLRAAPVFGEPVLLERLVGNLIDNAVRYNEVGGFVSVATGGLVLRVVNSGPVVGDSARLVEPFVRGDGVRSTGLGLSIVRAIVLAHHGELVIVARPEGGLDVTVRFATGSHRRG